MRSCAVHKAPRVTRRFWRQVAVLMTNRENIALPSRDKRGPASYMAGPLALRQHGRDSKPNRPHKQRCDDGTGDKEVPKLAALEIPLQIFLVLDTDQPRQGTA